MPVSKLDRPGCSAAAAAAAHIHSEIPFCIYKWTVGKSSLDPATLDAVFANFPLPSEDPLSAGRWGDNPQEWICGRLGEGCCSSSNRERVSTPCIIPTCPKALTQAVREQLPRGTQAAFRGAYKLESPVLLFVPQIIFALDFINSKVLSACHRRQALLALTREVLFGRVP